MSTATFPKVNDPLVTALGEQVVKGIKAVVEANTTLVKEEDSASATSEIDKQLKTFIKSDKNDVSDKDQAVVKSVSTLEKARQAFKDAQKTSRNLYRVNVLKQEEVVETDSDTEELEAATRSQRKVVMETITLIGSIAEANGYQDVLSWVKTVEIPQVGRQGTSTVGTKKPRARVHVNGKVYETFGEAAKALSVLLSTEDAPVIVTSPGLVGAWVEAGEKSTFTYKGMELKVTPKESTTSNGK